MSLRKFRYPTRIFVEGTSDAPVTTPANPTSLEDEDDFFSSWDKPKPKPAPAKAAPIAPPSIGRATSNLSAVSTTATDGTTTPRTVTSASLRSTSSNSSTSRPGKLGSRLGSSVAAPSTRPAKLGAKKAGATINFEEAERKAKEEEERIQKLGYDAKREAEEEKIRREADAAAAASSITASNGGSSKPHQGGSSSVVLDAKAPQAGQDLERLGMGMGRLGFGSAGSTKPTASTPSSRSVPDDAPTTAREKFGNQKGISSDMYFERNSYDPHAQAEARTRLTQFQGATSISSNQYFGREEEEGGDPDAGGMAGSPGSFTGNESLSALETATRDAISRVLANPDVQNVGESIRTGALKVCKASRSRHIIYSKF